jgi:LemA protein
VRAAVVVVLLGVTVSACGYNNIPTYEEQAKAKWADVNNQYQRRADLIPNLVETVKGYMKHERETLDAVIRARQTCVDLKNAGNIAELVKAEGALTQSLRGLFAVAESYPDLKANQNMLSLQEELKSTENRVGFARQAYNDAVMRLNNAIEMFPGSIIAGMGNFKQAVFFEVEATEERKAVKVSF